MSTPIEAQLEAARRQIYYALARIEEQEREIARLRAALQSIKRALEGLVGASTREELETIEAGVRVCPGAERDRAAALNAIHALQDLLTWEVGVPAGGIDGGQK